LHSRRSRLLAALALGLAALPLAAAHGVVVGERATSIISPPPEARVSADGDSDNAAFSQDGHKASVMAFDSAATNLVAGDTNAKRDVLILRRGSGDGNVGGELARVSVGAGAAQSNGDSIRPSISGDGKRTPRCVVFQSNATNLDRADRSPDFDVFLYDLKRKRTSLVSVRATNAVNGIVDGECEFVAYESRNGIFIRDLEEKSTSKVARGTNPDQATNGKGVAYERGGQVYYQAFLRKFRSKKKGGPYIKKNGREVMVSRNAAGSPGNGTSGDPSLDDNGYYVAFESTATNLCEGGGGCAGIGQADRNGAVSDIFRRTLSSKAPTNDHIQMVSYSQGCTRTDRGARTVDAQGDGASNNPAMTGAGENVLFDSEATNLRESTGVSVADANGPTRDVYYWNFPRERPCGNVSRESRGSQPREGGTGQPMNGPSVNPAASNRANYIGFTSTATGDLGETNGPGIADVFMRFLGASDEGRS
jgi:hypothetical protein